MCIKQYNELKTRQDIDSKEADKVVNCSSEY